MTEEEFRKAWWRVQCYGNWLSFLGLGLFIISAVICMDWARPAIVGFGLFLRKHMDEALVGLVLGLLISLIMIPFFLLLLLPFLWVDRRLGIRCPGCHRSVTLRCRRSQVLRTGQCCLCGEQLFPVENPS